MDGKLINKVNVIRYSYQPVSRCPSKQDQVSYTEKKEKPMQIYIMVLVITMGVWMVHPLRSSELFMKCVSEPST